MGLSVKPTGKFKSQLKRLENEAKKRAAQKAAEPEKKASTAVDQ